MNLESIDVAPLDVVTAVPDLRRDLHVFVDYVRTREVKRSHRGNALSKADAKRLAKLLSDPDAVREVDEEGFSAWIDFVDEVALRARFCPLRYQGPIRGVHQPGALVSGQLHRVSGEALRAVPRGEGREARIDAPGIAGPPGTGFGQRVLSPGRTGAVGWVQLLGIGGRRHAHARFRRGPPLPAAAAGRVPQRPVAEHSLAGRTSEKSTIVIFSFPRNHGSRTSTKPSTAATATSTRARRRGGTRSTSTRATRTGSSGSRADMSSGSWRVFRWCSATWTWRMRGSPPGPFIPRWAG